VSTTVSGAETYDSRSEYVSPNAGDIVMKIHTTVVQTERTTVNFVPERQT
jgi:hypothetical protein